MTSIPDQTLPALTDVERFDRIRRNARFVGTTTGFGRVHLNRQIIDDLLILDTNGALGRIAAILDRGRTE
jgi:hypothetical protein